MNRVGSPKLEFSASREPTDSKASLFVRFRMSPKTAALVPRESSLNAFSMRKSIRFQSATRRSPVLGSMRMFGGNWKSVYAGRRRDNGRRPRNGGALQRNGHAGQDGARFVGDGSENGARRALRSRR